MDAARNENVHSLVNRHPYRYPLNAGRSRRWGWNACKGWEGSWHSRDCLAHWTDDGLIAQHHLTLALIVVTALDAHAAKFNELSFQRAKIAGERGGGDFYAITRQGGFVESLAGFGAHGFATAHICLEGAGKESSRCRVYEVLECLIHV